MSEQYAARYRFVPGQAGNLFLAEYLPERQAQELVVIVPPLVEEMNRARRMFTLQAKQLASNGLQVCMPDLYGTGESDGEFSDATWGVWMADIRTAIACATGGSTLAVTLLCLRAGALLALDAMRTHSIDACRLVFWSPCTDGESFIGQFLRTRLMAGMLARSGDGESMADLRDRLEAGESLEVAGYLLSPDLASSIGARKLEDLAVAGTPAVTWFEMASDASRPLPPQAGRTVAKLQGRGIDVNVTSVEGPRFWATPEIAVSPALLAATSAIFSSGGQS